MKNLFLTFLLIIVGTVTTQAQRSADLKMAIYEPVNNALLEEGQPFTIRSTIKHQGTDTIHTTDTVRLYLYINSFHIPFQTSDTTVDSFLSFTQQQLTTGDTFVYNPPPFFTNMTGKTNFCFKALAFDNNSDTINDPNLNDNITCFDLIIHGVSVKDVNNDNAISIFPNPATSIVNWKVDTKNQNLSISLYNSTGQVVYKTTTDKNEGTISVNELPAGLYFLNLSTDSLTFSTKVLIE